MIKISDGEDDGQTAVTPAPADADEETIVTLHPPPGPRPKEILQPLDVTPFTRSVPQLLILYLFMPACQVLYLNLSVGLIIIVIESMVFRLVEKCMIPHDIKMLRRTPGKWLTGSRRCRSTECSENAWNNGVRTIDRKETDAKSSRSRTASDCRSVTRTRGSTRPVCISIENVFGCLNIQEEIYKP